LFIRLTVLDGLLTQKSMKKLEKKLQDELKMKKIGTGLNSLSSDLLRSICLSSQLPTAGLISNSFLTLTKKSPNYRSIFEYIESAFRNV
jgi:hypothetical protein